MADIGSTLGGRYRLVELLGQGGMATIYRAHDAQLDRHVAVKLLRPEYGRDPDFGSRFRQEAQSAASLNDPNIVAVHDFGQDPSGPFIVMELVDGEDLASILRRNGPLPPRQAARIVAEAARALSTAHARGFVHRDVKPGNIMLARDGRVKVADFGIARAVAEAQMTLPGTTLGSVHYFSPEQARGEPAVASSDTYSLGIVLFELLTGRRPWEGDSAAGIALARLTGMAPRPSEVRSGIPPALDAIVAKAMAIDPHDRFASATAFAESIETFLADRSASVGPAAGAAGAAAAGAAGATIASGVARPNPSARVPYSPDAYAGGDEPAPRPRAVPAGRRAPLDDDPDEPARSSPWVWISGLLAILILAAVGFVLFQFLAGGGERPPDEVEVPRFVGLTVEQAEAEADRVGLEVVQAATEERTDVPEGQVLAQDPAEGETAARGSEVRLTVAVGPGAVAVPDLRGRTEAEAIQLIIAAGLAVGERTEAFDPIIPEGAVISQDPRATIEVARGTAVNYELSQGPEPSPSPSPSPSPTPTPSPSPTPKPTDTPPVTLNVGDYRCMRLDAATAALVGDGFSLGSVTPQPEGYSAAPDSTVIDQSPAPGQKRPPGTAIDLVVYDPASLATCPP